MTGNRVAVIDDEPGIRHFLELELTHLGFEVGAALDGATGFDLVRKWSPDVLILDVVMPNIDGISLLPLLRSITQAPILVLSARGSPKDKVAGMANGADYYLAKPFEMQELLALIRAALRRPILGQPEFLRFGGLVVNLEQRTAERDGVPIELTSREFDVLTVFMKEPRRVFTRRELLDRLWRERDVNDAIIDTYICYLRAKIDAPFKDPLLHSIRGVGYALRLSNRMHAKS
jgi:DNA-binding response OmpR family regulator